MDEQTELLRRQVRAGLLITETMSASEDWQTILRQMLAALTNELGYKAAVRLLDPEQGRLELAAAYGFSADFAVKSGRELANEDTDREVLSGRILSIPDLATKTAGLAASPLHSEAVRSMLAVPLKVGGKPSGILHAYKTEVHQFSEDEQAFLVGIANLVGRTVSNARLYQAFHKIASQVNSTLEVRQVLRNLLNSLITELNIKAAAVRLLGPSAKRLHLAASEGLSRAYLDKGEIRVSESPIDQRVITDNQPIYLLDVVNEPGFQYPQEAQREGIRSVLAVPLRLHEEVIGILRVYSAQPHRFTSEEIALVETVADLGAIALENARLHETLREKYEAAREDWSGWFRYLALS